MYSLWWNNRRAKATEGTAHFNHLVQRCEMVYLFCSRPISLSTWMRTAASPRDDSTTAGWSCCFPLVNAGILSQALTRTKDSATLNPLSARTTSPGDNNSRNPLFSVTWLSLVLPPRPFENKADDPLWNYGDDCVMMLILRICLCSCFHFLWSFDKYFKAINNTGTIFKTVSITHLETTEDLISAWPLYDITQPDIHNIQCVVENPSSSCRWYMKHMS